MTSKEDCERLMNAVLPTAETMLRQHGEFYPFGGYLDSEGGVTHVGGIDKDTDHPRSRDLIFVLRDAFQNLAQAARCRATALVFDVRVTLPGSINEADTIQVCLDHRDGYSAEVFLPYQLVAGEIVYGETFAQKGKSEVFI
jgi:hypothetical protein